MAKTLQTKQGTKWTNDAGQTFPAAPLYRFVDENGEGGCWYSTLERAEQSWKMWTDGAAGRASRRAENARLEARIAAADARA